MQVISVRPSHLFGTLGAIALGAAALVWSPWSAQARSDEFASPRASTVAMNCAPGQQALVRQHVASGDLQVAVECAGPTTAAAAPVTYRSDLEPATYVAAGPRVVPAVYTEPAPPDVPAADVNRTGRGRREPRRTQARLEERCPGDWRLGRRGRRHRRTGRRQERRGDRRGHRRRRCSAAQSDQALASAGEFTCRYCRNCRT